MESKRRAFPRFYFVSTADLLDILSNGNNPAKVRGLNTRRRGETGTSSAQCLTQQLCHTVYGCCS